MSGSIEYWVTCALDPWAALENDDAFGEIAAALRDTSEYTYDSGIELSLEEAPPSFVPAGSVVVRVSGPSKADWDEVLELLDAMAGAGEGVVFSEDRQIVLDRRSVRPGRKAFDERPAWAVALADRLPGLHVVVTGSVAEPARELERVGLGALATRVTFVQRTGALEIRAAAATDALVAGQALSHATRGTAHAVGAGGDTTELPR